MISELKPVGQRPRCLYCQHELRPNFKRERMPLNIDTGEKFKVRPTGLGANPEEQEITVTRGLTEDERKQWRKNHPPQFLGTYGGYSDNRFCGLNCGYSWAVRHSQPQ
jgi:hypothetical protein